VNNRYEVNAYGFAKENGLKYGPSGKMEVGLIQGND